MSDFLRTISFSSGQGTYLAKLKSLILSVILVLSFLLHYTSNAGCKIYSPEIYEDTVIAYAIKVAKR